MELIRTYSKARLRTDKQPQTIARFQATLSTKQNLPDQTWEWTSPSTPFAVLYFHWPTNTLKQFPPENYTTVGTIGDLQDWIGKSKSTFHFLIHDVVLGILTLVCSVIPSGT